MKFTPILIFVSFVSAILLLDTNSYQPTKLGVRQGIVLPNYAITPGSLNPNVKQSNISETICKPNWTATIRPPVSYTNKLKIQQIKQYGYTDITPSNYEEDHLISLVLGGAPSDPKNLWPQSYKTTPNARDKDVVEMYLHRKVCDGSMTLIDAQTAIRTDWTAVYKQMISKLGAVEGQDVIDQDDN